MTAGDPRADNTDVYAFTSPDKPDTVTLVANWLPFQEPNGGPNFYPFAKDARYNIKIDADGNGEPDTTYTWEFTDHIRDDADQFLYNTGVVKSVNDETLNFRQTYSLKVTDNDGNTKTVLKDSGDAVDTPYREPGDTFPYVALPNTAAVNQADSLHPNGGVGAGLGGLASGAGFPVVPVTALGGGALLACAGVLALRRRHGAGRA